MMVRVTDTNNEITQFLRNCVANHDSITAHYPDGSTKELSTCYIKWELIPYLKYGLAKLGNIVALSVKGDVFYKIIDGRAYTTLERR